MACTLSAIQTACCSSQICLETDPIKLLQIIAQINADQLLVIDPGADISLDAILTRACSSGILKETNPITLLQVIAQNGCDLSA